jgi:hypothetical protein
MCLCVCVCVCVCVCCVLCVVCQYEDRRFEWYVISWLREG